MEINTENVDESMLQLTLTLNANAAAKEMLPLTLTPKLKKLLVSHSRAVQLLKC